MRHLLLVILCGWLSGMQGGMSFHSTLHTRQSSTKSDKYQVWHRCSYFSWWWAHSCLKHVEKRNKHTKKNCAPSWLYLQDYTRMHGQQNIKFCSTLRLWLYIFYLRMVQSHENLQRLWTSERNITIIITRHWNILFKTICLFHCKVHYNTNSVSYSMEVIP